MRGRVVQIDVGGCEGCSVSFLKATSGNMNDAVNLYTVNRTIDELFEEMEVVLISGAVCIDEEEVVETVKEARRRANVVVAFGSCASFGGIMRFSRGGQEPRPSHRFFVPVSKVIDVDYTLPGCPPPAPTIKSFINALLSKEEGKLALFSELSKIKKLSGFDLIDDVVLAGLCIGCGACEISCPTHAIKLIDKIPNLMAEKCIRCGTCYVRCPRSTKLLIMRGEKDDNAR